MRAASMAAFPFFSKSAAKVSKNFSVSLLRDPLGRPAGLPDLPFSNSFFGIVSLSPPNAIPRQRGLPLLHSRHNGARIHV